jgi:methylmalonyl-CoA mutase
MRFAYTFESAGNLIEETTAIFKKILADLAEWMAFGLSAESFFSKCIFQIHPDSNYFKQIILTRTLHLLWNNLLRSHGDEINTLKSGFLETHIAQNPAEEPDPFLIRASMSGLAASLAGTTALYVDGLMSEKGQDFYTRINRNIHHLLHLESEMYKGKDPLAGAYAIDFHTKRWVNKIWSGLGLQERR